MIITIKGAKNDQMREGRTVYIAKTDNKVCPVRALKKWRNASTPTTPDTPMFGTKGRKLDYKAENTRLKGLIEKEGEDPRGFALHSFRAGGATLAAREGIPLEDIQRHGRWKDPQSLNTYINPAAEQKYAVSRAIFEARNKDSTPHGKWEQTSIGKARKVWTNQRKQQQAEMKQALGLL